MSVLRNPGSEEAQALGCSCPALDNHNGQGIFIGDDGPLYWVSSGCRLHGDRSNAYDEDEELNA